MKLMNGFLDKVLAKRTTGDWGCYLDSVDKFLHTPKSVIESTESIDFYTHDEHPDECVGKYAGLRSKDISEIDPVLFKFITNKFMFWTYGLHPEFFQCKMSCYFSKIQGEDIGTFHRDEQMLRSGVIYLKGSSGTTLYDDSKDIFGRQKKLKEFKFQYNRMVSYDPNTLHGVSKPDDDRLVIVFFLKEMLVHFTNQSNARYHK